MNYGDQQKVIERIQAVANALSDEQLSQEFYKTIKSRE